MCVTVPASSLAELSQDILNFALNLEYLEAQFYHIAAFGTQLSQDLLSGTGNRGYVQVRSPSRSTLADRAGQCRLASAVQQLAHPAIRHLGRVRSRSSPHR